MGFLCIPIDIFAVILQFSVDVFYFFLQVVGFGPAPDLGSSIGSIFGCNV